MMRVLASAPSAESVTTGALAALAGLVRRDALTVGALMNTRGLTELIAIQVACSAGVIDGRLYAVFVLMALITTAVTGPLLDLPRRSPAAAAPRPREEPCAPALT